MATMSIPDSSTAQNMLIHGVGLGQDDLADAEPLAVATEPIDLVGDLQKIDISFSHFVV